MKKLKNFIPITVIIILLSSLPTYSQSLNWLIDPQVKANRVQIVNQDIYDNYYIRAQYYDTINFPDTSFYHPDNTQGTYDAIAKYSVNGEFIGAVDFYSLPNKCLFNNISLKDSRSNLYVAGSFQEKLFCNDLVLNHGGTPNTFVPDAFIIKLDSNFNIVWSDIISGDLQENLLDFKIVNDDKIFIATNHISGGIVDSENFFLGQDTTYHDYDFLSITRINSEKELIWNREVEGKISGNMNIGLDGKIHFFGRSWTHIYIDGDTLFNPNGNENPPESYCNFILSYNQEGDLLEAQFIDIDLFLLDGHFDSEGNIYSSAEIRDTLIFEGDTLYGGNGGPNYILIKLNSQRDVEWYKTLEAVDSYFHMVGIPMVLKDDKIFFAISSETDFYLEDTLITSEHPVKSVYGEFNNTGELKWHLTLQSDFRIRSTSLFIDNCSNILINGVYNGSLYFPNDTISTNTTAYYDQFFGKINIKEPYVGFMGNDSTYCDNYQLTAPPDYQFYLWNDSLTQENNILITQSEEFHVAIRDEFGCWEYDTISIEIQDGFTFDLGADTSILSNDTILISAPDNMDYDSYLWSNGSSIENAFIIGHQYGIGKFPIWLELSSGVCTASDTLILEIKNSSGIAEFQKDFQVYPIPANNSIYINWDHWDNEQVIYNIVDMYGMQLIQGSLMNKVQEINVSTLGKGIYFLKILDKNNKTDSIIKLIKN